ncbi:hypothetical protein C8F04DRAFT_1249156 [Mycena alexandri]|uniref:BTB domain-containing protein n=1 Tax=Mycena alexandri TaxID=1745969 RepID=A0AAD6XHU6_9AGAR|nr:hypothetical protein C8F04DRAFT_1249156 [Mycena alexandri]
MASQHDPDLYFDDGNIVLSAKDGKEQAIYFRLYRGILAYNSPVFSDMLAMPPPQIVEHYDGVPLVEMPDDADDLRVLLSLLFAPQSISGLLNARDFPSKLLEPTRLAKKYQIDWILQAVALQLQKSWPTTLLGWDGVIANEDEEEGLMMGGGWNPLYEDGTLESRLLPDPVSSIHIARLCDTPAILPFAFYRLLTWLTPEHENSEEAMFASWKNAPREELISQQPEDWPRLVKAQKRVGRWFADEVSSLRSNPCPNQPPCQEKTRAWFSFSKNVGRNGDFLLFSKYHSDPTNRSEDSLAKGLCPICKPILQGRINALRWKFAGQLSYFFQLEEVVV